MVTLSSRDNERNAKEKKKHLIQSWSMIIKGKKKVTCKEENLFDAREIEVKAIVDPSENLVSPHEVCTVHDPDARRHFNFAKTSQEKLKQRKERRERD